MTALDYYKLQEQPFGVTPDSRFVFLTSSHKEALNSLVYGIESGCGFVALIAQSEMEGRDLVFVVGGADGLPPAWRARADLLLALSPMTFPHELARAMLAEQIYRAFATLRGHPYPR